MGAGVHFAPGRAVFMFRIKICGITTVDDALVAAEAGADAIGLNFYPGSPRFVAPEQARRIADAVAGRLLRVGVMVDPGEDEAVALAQQAQLDVVQLHGNEPPGLAAALSRRLPLVKAFRIGPGGLGPVLEYLERLLSEGGSLRAVLFDACRPGQLGGSGVTADWTTIRDFPSEEWHPPSVLAGGLTPENVASAIRSVRPAGIDTASGVERSPGRKDPLLVARFVHEAREGFRSTSFRSTDTGF
jgi:phosphoribosylanthranilate isomerase